MLVMVWISRELSNSKIGLIAKLSVLVKKLTAFKNYGVARSSNPITLKKN